MTRKEAIRQYKERKPNRGVFSFGASGDALWVDSTPNLDSVRNSLEFELRHGGHHNKVLQEAWNARGGKGFAFAVLEKFDEDVSPLALHDLAKQRRAHWAKQLNARTIAC